MFRTKKLEMGIPGGLALGILTSILVTLVGTASASWLIAGGTVGEDGVPVVACILQLIGAATGALTSTLCIKKMRLQICMLSGLIYYLTLLGITALFFDGEYAGMGLAALMIVLGCACVAIWAPNNKYPGRKRKRGYR